ncbi:MAG: ANTAR domain-containing protein, partial [Egicoccus sp.]
EDQLVVQAMGDIATIGLLRQREANRAATVTNQLQQALHSRISIEQAKGVISEQSGRSIDDSFAMLRGHARNHNRKLSELARAVVEREIDAAGLGG